MLPVIEVITGSYSIIIVILELDISERSSSFSGMACAMSN